MHTHIPENPSWNLIHKLKTETESQTQNSNINANFFHLNKKLFKLSKFENFIITKICKIYNFESYHILRKSIEYIV